MKKFRKLWLISIVLLTTGMLPLAHAGEPVIDLDYLDKKIPLQPELSLANQNLALLLWSLKNNSDKDYIEDQQLNQLEDGKFGFVYIFTSKVPDQDNKVQVVSVTGRGELREDGNFYVSYFYLEESKSEIIIPVPDNYIQPSGGVGIGTRPPLDLPDDWDKLLPPTICKF